MGSSQSTGAIGKHLTGFDDEIKLGELGEILENDSPVMSIEMVDRDGVRLGPDPNTEYRWRGVSMDSVRRRALVPSSRPGTTAIPSGRPIAGGGASVVRQLIKLEPTDSPILFGFRPILEADAPDKRFQPALNETDGTLFRLDARAVSFDYSVDSSTAGRPPPARRASYPSTPIYLKRLTAMPEALKAEAPPDRWLGTDQGRARGATSQGMRAAALERYLRDSGEFRYSLQMERSDPDLDPVEDFLLHRKSGHCEYFASALALMLRSIDIPTRMINGFKGADSNPAMARIMTVRRRSTAHSWVEAPSGRAVPGLDHPAADLGDARSHPRRPAETRRSPGSWAGWPPAFLPGHRFRPIRLDFLHRRLQLRTAGPIPLRADPHPDRRGPARLRHHRRDHPEVAPLPQSPRNASSASGIPRRSFRGSSC